MLSEICPVCNSPLFEIGDELRCLRCDKPVVIVREESETMSATAPLILSQLENVISAKIDVLTALFQKATEPDEIRTLSETLSSLLKLFHQSRRLNEYLRKK